MTANGMVTAAATMGAPRVFLTLISLAHVVEQNETVEVLSKVSPNVKEVILKHLSA